MTEVDKTPVLETSGLAVASGEITLLENVNLKIPAGHIEALTGPSGCGKSTMLRTLAGLINPAGGEILFHGKPPAEHGWPAYRRRVVFMDQKPVLFDLSVRKNLERPFSYGTASGIFPEETALQLMEKAGLGAERMDQPARSLSVGQQQRVCLIRTLLVEPEVLLLDEPTSALDDESVKIVEEMLTRLVRDAGRSAIVVTHDKSQAERLCGGVCNLDKNLCVKTAGGKE